MSRARPGPLDAALEELRQRHAEEEAALVRRWVEGALVEARGCRGEAAAALGVGRRRFERMVAACFAEGEVKAIAEREGWATVGERCAWAREGRRATPHPRETAPRGPQE